MDEIEIEVDHPEFYFDSAGKPVRDFGGGVHDHIRIGSQLYRLIRPGEGNAIVVQPVIN